ncbi:MAG: glycosyltransferase family 4 protein [Candidatus Polarisedimenticolaceae bacterium]|nr:glycosyltransferase family 4 protein [Candidatus Polarisedimenticolaceae bacterium]
MKKILFISKGSDSASTRYRATDFFPLLKQAGWQATHLTDRRTPLGRLNLLKQASQADVVVVVRRTFGPLFAGILRRVASRLIFTFDDAIFAKSDGSPSRGRERRFAATVALCDVVWAGNSYLADKAKAFNGCVEVVPTVLDVDRYATEVAKPADSLDLVWIGSSSTKKHLLPVIPLLEEAAALIPELRLKIIADFSIESERLNVVPILWSPESELRELLASHIGIAPLPDNAFTRGKCGLKVLQYMAAGLPVISSAAGVNRELVDDGVSGFLVSSDQQWLEAIQALAKSPEQRRSMGETGLQRCRDHFTLQAALQKMLATL